MSRRLGQVAEHRACAELQRQGLRLLERNYSCRHGELDLIMQDRDELVFVEVRLRRNDRHGDGAASITASKRRRLILTAQSWLQRHPGQSLQPCRFDVVSCQGDPTTGALQWLRAAFEAA